MSFTLIIDIRGLCLFAPHEGDMHVLLPDESAGPHGGHHPPHFAQFLFNAKYNAPGHNNSGRAMEPFDGLRWDLGAIAPGAADLTLPPVVGDVEKYVLPRRKLPRHQVRRRQQRDVKSHMVLTRGACACHGVVPLFDIGSDRDVPMVSMLRWVIESIPGETLDWAFENLDGTPAGEPAPLAPVDGIIQLTLLHAPNELPNNVCDPGKPPHFPAYYPLFQGRGPTPRCTGRWHAGSCSGETLAETDNEAPNVFTCMIGKTDVDPMS